jgi:hypothetical protein
VGNSQIVWKLGIWDSPIGYESSSDPLNPNFTRSYGYMLEPTTFTGLLGTYKLNDMISLSAGVANATQGNATDGAVPYETQKAYMGTIALTAPESWGWAKGATLNAGIINDDIGSASRHSGMGATWLYVGAVVPTPLTALKVGASFDYKDLHNTSRFSTRNPSDDNLWVAGLYANYQFNDKLDLNVRGEYGSAENVGFVWRGNSFNNAVGGHTSMELTATASYKLWENVLSRAEIRWDKAGTRAWDDTGRRNEVLLALNLIYQF